MDNVTVVSIQFEWLVYGPNFKAFDSPYFRYTEAELMRAKMKLLELGNGAQLWVDCRIRYSDDVLLNEQVQMVDTRHLSKE